ncbi:hypothetical protein C0J52_16196 [Blattella germanica]|nr:hypothetical protein C0J52_16196 [Blattella germanica]
MSSGFISEAELAEQRRIRQEEWEKVRKPDQPEECPEEEYDHRSLFERLEEQKQKRELEYEEAHRLKNMIKGLDDDEVEFLDLVDRSKLEEERRKSAEEAREIKDFRNAVATLQERSLEERIQTEIRTRPPLQTGASSGRSSQMRLLAGAVVKKRPADAQTVASEKKSRSNEKGDSSNKTNGTEPTTASTNSAVAPTENGEMSKKRKDREEEEEEKEVQHSTPNGVGLHCIGVLPGLGVYPDSSDSEQSSDTDQELSTGINYDLCGRKISSHVKAKSSSTSSR